MFISLMLTFSIFNILGRSSTCGAFWVEVKLKLPKKWIRQFENSIIDVLKANELKFFVSTSYGFFGGGDMFKETSKLRSENLKS